MGEVDVLNHVGVHSPRHITMDVVEDTPEFRQQAHSAFKILDPILSQQIKLDLGTPIKPPVPATDTVVKPSASLIQDIQSRLYDRKEEEDLITRAYERRIHQCQRNEFLLISGPCGTGKTRLARSLEKQTRKVGGLFLTGKFDQIQRPEPYTGVVQALTQLTDLVCEGGDKYIRCVRRAITEELGDDASVLIDMIPGIERIIGSQVSAVKTKPGEAAKRFLLVFKQFMRAVCSRQHPIILLLDDLQWADPCSLELVRNIVIDWKNEGLFVVGTCEDNVSPGSSLSKMLRRLEDDENMKILNVALGNLSEQRLHVLLKETIALVETQQDFLTAIIWKQTLGNYFYIVEFIRWLLDEDLLRFDTRVSSWTVQKETLMGYNRVSQLGNFLVDRLEQLPDDVKEVIKTGACFGSEVPEMLLTMVIPSAGEHLRTASELGVLYHEGGECNKFVFRHDGFQSAAYSLIPVEKRESYHLNIGRQLWKRLAKCDCDKFIFLVLSQIGMGRQHLQNQKEKNALAFLCLDAGQRSAKAGSFRTALIYLNLGLDLLGRECWREEYELSLALHNAAAEMEVCMANYDRVHELLELVFQNVHNFRDRLQSYCTLVYTQGITDNASQAVDTGIDVLKNLGETFPFRLCNAHLMQEMRSIKALLRGKSDEQLLRTPNLEDPDKVMALHILNLMFLSAMTTRPKIAPFIALKAMRITLTNGLCAMSSVAFSSFGLICAAVGQHDEAYRYAQIGLQLLERFEAKEYLPRVYASLYGCIYHWKKPVEDALDALLVGKKVGLQTGDNEFAVLNGCMYCDIIFYVDESLSKVEGALMEQEELCTTHQNEMMLGFVKTNLLKARSLMGLVEDPVALSADSVEQVATRNDVLAKHSCMQLKLHMSYTFGDYSTMLETVDEVFISRKDNRTSCASTIFDDFISGMSHLEVARRTQGMQRKKHLGRARTFVSQFKTWARQTPHNASAQWHILKAELASIQGKNKKAYEKFISANALAACSGSKLLESLANERTARHLFRTGDTKLARQYFDKALAVYEGWGAQGKYDHLEKEVRGMYEPITFEASQRFSLK